MNNLDAIVIGAGPAGAATALFLAQKGYQVAVFDRARFPRDKVCGEFISPAADDLLHNLGVLENIEATRPVRLAGVALNAYEKNEIFVNYPVPDSGTSPRPTSLSLERTVLDTVLVERLKQEGITVYENHDVQKLLMERNRIIGIEGMDPSKIRFRAHARVVIDAAGRNALSLRKLKLKRVPAGASKVALAAHWEGVRLPTRHCYMHASPPGYTGMSHVRDSRVNVVLVVDRREIPSGDLNRFYENAVLKNRHRHTLLNGGRPAEPPRTIDSLAFSTRPVPCDGLALVGDAMGFIDPFTGEGIYLALKSAQIASETIDRALRSAPFFSLRDCRTYERLRRQEFQKKFWLSRILQFLIYRPSLCIRTVDALKAHPALAETLVGVLGDYFPANRVVSWSYLVDFLKGFLNRKSAKILRTDIPEGSGSLAKGESGGPSGLPPTNGNLDKAQYFH